jgi:hypothetical protein
MEAGLSLSMEEAAEEVMDTTPIKREAVTADMGAVAAADMAAEVVATVDTVATITEVVDTEVATISFNQDNTTIIIIVRKMENKRRMSVAVEEEILINLSLLMEIIKPSGLLMDRKRNQRNHLQRKKKLAPKKKLRMLQKYIKV